MRIICLLSFLVLLLTACEVDRDFVTGDAVQLRFGTDTLRFDTVFTARGSATRQFKVYNDGSDPVKIDRIAVAGETGVTFTFNADGKMGPSAEEVVIFGQDSIFVFVEAEVDPTQPEEVSPFIAEDRIVFTTGGTERSVVLEAFGQNANYLNGFRAGGFFQPICQDGTFTLPTDLPTVIYGSMFVDSCTLQVLAGTRIYFHGGIQRNPVLAGTGIFNDGFIYALPEGRLELRGTLEDPILLASDRLETGFMESVGAYRGLIIGAGSRGNVLEHVTIRNSIVGVTADSLAEVTITDSRIINSSGPAVTGYQSDITVRNSLFHSNFSNSLQIIKGGNLVVEHTTIANYGVDAAALAVQNFYCDQATEECVAAPFTGRIRNSIVAGSRGAELALADAFEREQPDLFDLRVEHSVVRTDDRFLTANDGEWSDFYTVICSDCYNLQSGDALFESISEDDYRPDSLSVARGLADFLPNLPFDLDGNARGGDSPDAGALEWQPGQ